LNKKQKRVGKRFSARFFMIKNTKKKGKMKIFKKALTNKNKCGTIFFVR